MKKKQPDRLSNMRLAGLGVQMVAFIGIFVFIGYKLDQKLQPEKPWFTLGFSISGVILSMVYVIRTFLRES